VPFTVSGGRREGKEVNKLEKGEGTPRDLNEKKTRIIKRERERIQ